MTIDTVDATVVRIGLRESIGLVSVTGTAKHCRDIAGRNNFQGLVGRMTLGAVLDYLC